MTRKWRIRLFIFPVLALSSIVIVFPLIYSAWISLMYYYLPAGISPRLIGLKNYITVFQDPDFYSSLGITFKIAIFALSLELVIGFMLALLLNKTGKGKSIITSFLVLPLMIASAATGLTWRLLLHPQYGPVNAILSTLMGRRILIDWLGKPGTALFSVVMVDVWRAAPFVMLILLAGLSSIPKDLYESARVDGGSSFDLFKYITLPLLKLPIIIVIILRTIDVLKIFDSVYILTQGGPARTTETISFYIYFVGLRYFRMGYSASLSFILLFMVLILVISFLKVTSLRKGKREVA